MSRRPIKRILSSEAWLARGVQLYGPDPRSWVYRCVACGHLQSQHSVALRQPHLTDIARWISRACEGCYCESVGCELQLGGVHMEHRLEIDIGHQLMPAFEYAKEPPGDWRPYQPPRRIDPRAKHFTIPQLER